MTDPQTSRDHTRFDWFFTLLSGWFVTGAFMDGWAHNHLEGLETFFTPWHGVLYSGFGALAAFLGYRIFINHRKGQSWREAVPPGYDISILGVALFFAGGAGDMIWHLTLGIEQGIEALLSPTHLLLAVGGVLMVHGPFHAGRVRAKQDPSAKIARLPMLLSLMFTLSLISFMTQFAHPVKADVAGAAPALSQRDQVQSLAVAGILLQTLFMMGTIILATKRWTMPFGGLTVTLMFNQFAMGFMSDRYLLSIPAALAGFAADLLYDQLRPSVERIRSMHLFAFAVPVIYYALYFLTLHLSEGGIWWSVHMWTGTVVLTGIAGLLLSYLISPHWQPKKSAAPTGG